MGLPVQQNRRRDCSHAARCLDLGDAGDLCRRISFGLLEFALADGASRAFSPIRTTRLRALECFFTGRLADFLAGVCWLPVSRHPFGRYRVFRNPHPGKPRSNVAEN